MQFLIICALEIFIGLKIAMKAWSCWRFLPNTFTRSLFLMLAARKATSVSTCLRNLHGAGYDGRRSAEYEGVDPVAAIQKAKDFIASHWPTI